jgi:HPr kinase/phosphorylase
MTGALAGEISLHATAMIYGERGVLILGPSGSGKSALALALMARARSAGTFWALIGDDRVFVRKANNRLVGRGAASMAGLIERRMVGLITVRHEAAAVIRLGIELCEHGRRWPRMPEDQDSLVVGEVALPRLALDSSLSFCDQALVVEERLAILRANPVSGISLEHSAAVHKNGPSAMSPPA